MQNEKNQAQNKDDLQFPKKVQIYHVNFEGNFGQNFVTPRGLKANLMNQMVAVQGIVTKMSLVKPRIQTSVHYCEATKRGMVRSYNDQNNIAEAEEGKEGTNAFPTKDATGNPLSAEYGFCVYKDSQVVTL